MKLATLDNGTADGRLLVVSRDLARAVEAAAASTLQAALDHWAVVEPKLRADFDALQADPEAGFALDQAQLMAVMPRSYQFLDGSAFLAHNHILADAWGYERRTPADPPLMYQGLSDRFFPPHGEVAFRAEADDVDFEAEYGVITDRVPLGVSPDEAIGHARLLLLINDWSLRAFGPAEMKAGFGFLHAKPPSTLSGIAVTPDELGAAWAGGVIHLPLVISRGSELFGRPDGVEMTYDFGRLIAHAAATRELCAGTVLGSGTVSNKDAARVGSGCIAERRALDTLAGAPTTPYLRSGERIRLECLDAASTTIFGVVDQIVRVAEA